MRPTREQALQNKQRILDEAARLYREKGIQTVGIDEIMKAAGLTHGGFYGHFNSKDDLVNQAVEHAAAQSRHRQRNDRSINDLMARYLSAAHRDEPGEGCLVAALGPELARCPQGRRKGISAYVQALIGQVETLQARQGGEYDRGKAIAAMASLLGALIMSRATNGSPLSDEILTETARYWSLETSSES